MNIEDVQPPEFIIDGMAPGGRMQKVPFLYQREGETWNQFCARMKRVSDSLNDHAAPENGLTIRSLIMIFLFGLLVWLAILGILR